MGLSSSFISMNPLGGRTLSVLSAHPLDKWFLIPLELRSDLVWESDEISRCSFQKHAQMQGVGVSVKNQLLCLIQGAFCQELGYSRHVQFMPALYSRLLLLLIAFYFPLGTVYSRVSMACPFSLSTHTFWTCWWFLAMIPCRRALWPQKHAQPTCVEQVRYAAELMAPGAVLHQK